MLILNRDLIIVDKDDCKMANFKDDSNQKIQGHILVRDLDTNQVIMDRYNAVHFENASIAIARALANRPDGNIHELHFGNGGSTISGTGAITYFPPNVSGMSADLYNPTYFKVINDLSPLNPDPTRNFIEIKHLVGTVYTDIIITCTLEYGEPSGQEAFDDATNLDGDFVFDEMGLKLYDPVAGNGLLLTHVCFNPIQKSLNRMIEIIYTLRVTMV